jgi:hypothetical protein
VGAAPDPQGGAGERGAFAHGREAHATVGGERLGEGRVEPSPVVRDLGLEGGPRLHQSDPDLAGLGVRAHVGQGLVDDLVDELLGLRRDALAATGIEVDLQSVPRRGAFARPPDGFGEG